MGLNDLFDKENARRANGSSEPYIPLKKDLEYRKRIQELKRKDIEFAMERHKLVMDNLPYYRQNNCYPEKVIGELAIIDKKQEDNLKLLKIEIAKYNSYYKHQSK